MATITRSSSASARRGAVARSAVLLALLTGACSADPPSATATRPAAAQENTTTAATCYDWPAGTTPVACALGKKGPGGGRIFSDGGADRPDGQRFLEVAPQNWNNGELYDCPGEVFGSSCGAASGIAKKTGDYGRRTDRNTDKAADGYLLCGNQDAYGTLKGYNGSANALYDDPLCNNGVSSAVKDALEYRGGGMTDWRLPLVAEMIELCGYPGRNDIGGFINGEYVTDAVSSGSLFALVSVVHTKNCENPSDEKLNHRIAVRPMRQF